jgi:hypothetical protein
LGVWWFDSSFVDEISNNCTRNDQQNYQDYNSSKIFCRSIKTFILCWNLTTWNGKWLKRFINRKQIF